MTHKEKRARRVRRQKITVGTAVVLGALLALGLWLHGHTVSVLQPRGTIASQERSLLWTATWLGLLVIIPVYAITIFIFWKYRETHQAAKKYTPSWDHSRWLEIFWWAVPLMIITVLSVIAWRSSYALDPFKPLASRVKPLTVQVIALDWKWLFIYPDQKVASVNQVPLPVNRPIDFEITSDTVMNSFWIPQLSGQIYAMPGMSTQLHLMAGKSGNYYGSSANISGSGFAGMAFTAKAEPAAAFQAWVSKARQSPQKLSLSSYAELAKPSKNNPVATYALAASNLYDYTVMKYMEPGAGQ